MIKAPTWSNRTKNASVPTVDRKGRKGAAHFPAVPEVIAAGAQGSADIFAANQARETAPFMGHTVVQARLASLVNAPVPLVTPALHALTDTGRRVLTSKSDTRELNGLDRWNGGTHLKQ